MLLRMLSSAEKHDTPSARFIHERLIEYVHGFMRDVRDRYHLGEAIEPLLVAWPRRPAKDDAGYYVTHAVIVELKKEDMPYVQEMMLKTAARIDAYALLLFNVTPEAFTAVLETPYGAHAWHMELQKRGDTLFLKEPVARSDETGLRIVWRPQTSEISG